MRKSGSIIKLMQVSLPFALPLLFLQTQTHRSALTRHPQSAYPIVLCQTSVPIFSPLIVISTTEMANNQDVQAILAALSQAGPPGTGMAPQQAQYSPYASNQGPPGAPSYQQPPPQAPPGQAPAPAYSGVIPTPPPGNYSQYGLPQPTASGSIDLNSIRPASHGNVNFQDALSKVKEYASARGIQSPNGAGMFIHHL